MSPTSCTEPQCLYKGALYLASVPVQGCTFPYLSACTRGHFTLPQCLYKGHFTLPQCLTRGHFTLPQCLYKGTLYLTSVPVQGGTLPYLNACTREHFTLPQCLYKGALYLTSVPVQGCTLPYLSACTRVHFPPFQYCFTMFLRLQCLQVYIQNVVFSHLTKVCCMTCPSHPPPTYQPSNNPPFFPLILDQIFPLLSQKHLTLFSCPQNDL